MYVCIVYDCSIYYACFLVAVQVLLPSGFEPKPGRMMHSNPNDRMKTQEDSDV